MKRIILLSLFAASSAVYAMQKPLGGVAGAAGASAAADQAGMSVDKQLMDFYIRMFAVLNKAKVGSDLSNHVAQIRDMLQRAITNGCTNRVENFNTLIGLLEKKGALVATIAELRIKLEQLRTARTAAQAQKQTEHQVAVDAAREQFKKNIAYLERIAAEQDVAAFRAADVEASIKQALESIDRLPDAEQAAGRAQIDELQKACLAQFTKVVHDQFDKIIKPMLSEAQRGMSIRLSYLSRTITAVAALIDKIAAHNPGVFKDFEAVRTPFQKNVAAVVAHVNKCRFNFSEYPNVEAVVKTVADLNATLQRLDGQHAIGLHTKLEFNEAAAQSVFDAIAVARDEGALEAAAGAAGAAQVEADRCGVCFGAMAAEVAVGAAAAADPAMPVITLPCHATHKFHKQCLLRTFAAGEVEPACPVCKRSVLIAQAAWMTQEDHQFFQAERQRFAAQREAERIAAGAAQAEALQAQFVQDAALEGVDLDEALLDAAFNGHAQTIEFLLGLVNGDGQPRVNVNTQDHANGNNTSLHFAAWNGHVEAINVLLEHGAVVDARNAHQRTPLYLAAWNGHVGAINALLDGGANKEARAEKQLTPLHVAADNGHAEAIKALLDGGANKEARAENQATPLHYAALKGHVEAINVLLARLAHGAHIDARDVAQDTPLHFAAWNGHVEAINALLDRGAVIEIRNVAQDTPLHYAAWKGHVEAIKALCDRGAVVDAREEEQATPLHWAAMKGHVGAIKVLCERGAHIDARDEYNKTPLALAYGDEARAVLRAAHDARAAADGGGAAAAGASDTGEPAAKRARGT